MAPNQKATILKWAESNSKMLTEYFKKYYGFSLFFPFKNNFLKTPETNI